MSESLQHGSDDIESTSNNVRRKRQHGQIREALRLKRPTIHPRTRNRPIPRKAGSNEKELVAAAILRAQDELEMALSELDMMPMLDPHAVAHRAHALNNFLTVSSGTVKLLSLTLADHPEQDVHNLLMGLGHATELMRQTVSQLMSSAVPQDTKLRMRKWDLVLHLVPRICTFYQRVADQKQIVIKNDFADNVAPVWTDPLAVAAVLDNLLSNAVKFSQPGKRIWVEVRAEQDIIVCSIRDEGPGLSAADQEKLFQHGVRLSPQPTGDELSSGYGLAVAKDLVEKLGGQLWCESIEGQGSRFSFSLLAYRGQDLETESS